MSDILTDIDLPHLRFPLYGIMNGCIAAGRLLLCGWLTFGKKARNMKASAPAWAFFKERLFKTYELKHTSMDAFISYLKNVRAEVRKVTWPTRRQATLLTVLVVAVSLLVAAYLGLFDFVLARLLDMFII